MKMCFKCGIEKPLTEFYKHSAMKDGHLGKCKQCTKDDSNKHRADNLESCQAYDRKRANLPHRVALRKEVTKTWVEDGRQADSQRRYRERYPEKYHARTILGNAVRDGLIIKPNRCVECGAKTKLEGHHDDYSKPLDVRWLCNSCHVDTRRKYPKDKTEVLYLQPKSTQMELFESKSPYCYV